MANREFVGEVYFDGNAYVGRWSVRSGNVVIEEDAIWSLSEDSARQHVRHEARTLGLVWKG